MQLLVTQQITGRLAPLLALVLVLSLVGCGDAVGDRQVTIRQFTPTLVRPGLLPFTSTQFKPGMPPFDVDASQLPREWGNVEMTNREGGRGPETEVRVPTGHRIRIVLMPTTQESPGTSPK